MDSVLVKKRYKPKKLMTWAFTLHIVLTMVCYFLPYTQYVLPYAFMAPLMLISFVWMINGVDVVKYSIAVVFMSLFLMFTVLILQDVSIVAGINNAIREIRFFIPVLWGVFALRFAEEKQRKVIMIAFLLVSAVIVFKTLQAVQVEPMIVRLLAQDKTRSTVEMNSYRLSNVAGYTFSYAMGIVVICSTWVAVNAHTKLMKALSILVLIVSFYFVVETMYATLLILSVLGIIVVFFVHSKNVFVRIILVILGLISFFFMEDITAWLSDLFSFSGVLHEKFFNIHNAIKYSDVSEVGSRPQLMREALENWISSPLFGSSTVNRAHSTVFAILQESGIIGLGFWISIIVMASKLVTRNLKNLGVDVRMFGLCIAYFVILSIFNDTRIIYELSITVFCLVPIFSLYIHEKTAQLNEAL